jgi:hypothetical protein
MRIRLNGWQRIGIVISVLWFIGGGIWGNDRGLHEGDWTVSDYKNCLDTHPNDWPGCQQKSEKNYIWATRNHWYSAAIFAVVPIPIGWLLAWGLVSLTRWVRRGFNT